MQLLLGAVFRLLTCLPSAGAEAVARVLSSLTWRPLALVGWLAAASWVVDTHVGQSVGIV